MKFKQNIDPLKLVKQVFIKRTSSFYENLIHETVDNQTVTTNIYTWGLDLSGIIQGVRLRSGKTTAGHAGGVGGLLSQTVI